jgi:5-formaminoimidazole-4-carboxamide-1-beta-D-ribofuranosyl 5'-monophosphate synthetase
MRIPGSPSTAFTPYSGYMYGQNLSTGQRMARELKLALKQDRIAELLT